jgi:hypothetical protein
MQTPLPGDFFIFQQTAGVIFLIYCHCEQILKTQISKKVICRFTGQAPSDKGASHPFITADPVISP